MERDGTGQLSTIYTYGNQRINSESYNNLSGLYTYDGRGSVSAVIGSYGDFRASYWYDGLGNVKSQIHGYGAFGSGKKYYGYNAEQYNPVTGNQNLRARQVNIRRQRFLSEDTFMGVKNSPITLNRYIYGNDNPLKYKDPSGFDTFGIGLNVSGGVGANTGTTFGTLRSDTLNGWTGFVSPSIGGDTNMGAGASLTIFHDNNNIENEKSSAIYIGSYFTLSNFGIPITIEYGRSKDEETQKFTGWSLSIGLGASAIPFGAKTNKSWLIVPDYNKTKKVKGIEFIPNTAIVSPQNYEPNITTSNNLTNALQDIALLNTNFVLCKE